MNLLNLLLLDTEISQVCISNFNIFFKLADFILDFVIEKEQQNKAKELIKLLDKYYGNHWTISLIEIKHNTNYRPEKVLVSYNFKLICYLLFKLYSDETLRLNPGVVIKEVEDVTTLSELLLLTARNIYKHNLVNVDGQVFTENRLEVFARKLSRAKDKIEDELSKQICFNKS
ncbi:hypothetical protein [Carp edema virus]|nr:hypothetical protein [Carp edema virus]